MNTSATSTPVTSASAANYVSGWFAFDGPLVALVQGSWGAATAVRLVMRIGGVSVLAGSYAPVAKFAPDADRNVEVVFSGRSLPPFSAEYRWEVTGNNAATNLQLIHARA